MSFSETFYVFILPDYIANEDSILYRRPTLTSLFLFDFLCNSPLSYGHKGLHRHTTGLPSGIQGPKAFGLPACKCDPRPGGSHVSCDGYGR